MKKGRMRLRLLKKFVMFMVHDASVRMAQS